MIIHLDEDIFNVVKNGTKTVEVRLYDEKRKNIKVGDKLTFLKRPLDLETIDVVVTKLEVFDSFNSLVDKYDMNDIYLENASRDDYLKLMERFYSKEDELKYGVLAISYEVM